MCAVSAGLTVNHAVRSAGDKDDWTCDDSGPHGDVCNWYGVLCTGNIITGIVLKNMQITGTISSLIGNLVDLVMIDLTGNEIRETIPRSVGNLQMLEYLYLGSNKLTGSLSPAIGQAQSLRILSISNNHIAGTVPTTMGLLDHMNYLDISHNSLSGPLPSSLCSASRLQGIDFSYNSFACYPTCLSAIVTLSSEESIGTCPNVNGKLSSDIELYVCVTVPFL